MNRSAALTPVMSLILLSACGGGGGSAGITPSVSPSEVPTQGPAVTNATVKVVDDGYDQYAAAPDPKAGQPLAGVLVRFEPWVASATPLPSPQATTDASGNATLNGVPNGHYLLVVGTDSTTDSTWATVHDNVTLTGGSITLKAPKLQSVPAGYTAPAWETNGSYRLAHIDQTIEAPCLAAWQAQRASRSLPAGVQDEWLTENIRANQGFFFSVSFAGLLYPIDTGGAGALGGVGSCATDLINSQIFIGQPSATYANDVSTLWFAGSETTQSASNRGTQTSAMAAYPIDPRSTTDPNYPNWP